MRNLLLIFILMIASPCFAEEEKWYVLNKELGCQLLTEVHDAWPYLDGSWTPSALLNALDKKYHDAKLVPFMNVVEMERKEAREKESVGDYDFFKDFTKSNAFILSSDTGGVDVPVITKELCKNLNMLPVEPEQWTTPLPKQSHKSSGIEISRKSWYAVRETNPGMVHFVVTQKLNLNDFEEISNNFASFYAGSSYSPEPNKHTYLVRGVSSGKTGSLHLFFNDGALFVFYQKSSVPLYFSPIVVNLPTPLTSVVISQQR